RASGERNVPRRTMDTPAPERMGPQGALSDSSLDGNRAGTLRAADQLERQHRRVPQRVVYQAMARRADGCHFGTATRHGPTARGHTAKVSGVGIGVHVAVAETGSGDGSMAHARGDAEDARI